MSSVTRNALREGLDGGEFIVTLEFCLPEAGTDLADLYDLAEFAGEDRRIHAIALTDRVTSEADYDPVEVAGEVMRRSGKVPLVHLSGKDRTLEDLADRLQRCQEEGFENVLCLTGDMPRPANPGDVIEPEKGYVDSVQGADLARRWWEGFTVGAAVSTFKYTEEEVLPQYMKMAKKLAFGADVIFNQVGYDLRKTQELPLWLQQAGLAHVKTIAAMYWLTPGFAKFANAGNVPGVIISDEAVLRIGEIAKESDKGLGRRREMMALQIALCRLFGYSGVHIGGFKKAGSIKAILDQADALLRDQGDVVALWQKWCSHWQLADADRMAELGVSDGFYFFEAGQHGLNSDRPRPLAEPIRQPLRDKLLRGMHDLFFTEGTRGYRWFMGSVRAIGALPGGAAALKLLEAATKKPIVGCEACGSCSMPETEYVCVEHDCAKTLPNGPCGGSDNTQCEVHKDRTCAWVKIYQRARAAGTWPELQERFVPAKDRSLRDTCSWLNMARGLDHRSVAIADRLLAERKAARRCREAAAVAK